MSHILRIAGETPLGSGAQATLNKLLERVPCSKHTHEPGTTSYTFPADPELSRNIATRINGYVNQLYENLPDGTRLSWTPYANAAFAKTYTSA
jgi:hypothetical protein